MGDKKTMKGLKVKNMNIKDTEDNKLTGGQSTRYVLVVTIKYIIKEVLYTPNTNNIGSKRIKHEIIRVHNWSKLEKKILVQTNQWSEKGCDNMEVK